MTKRTTFIILSSLFFVPVSNAEIELNNSEISAGRYIITDTNPDEQQRNLLGVVTSISFNENVITVGDAINATLKRTGYSLAPPRSSDPMLPVLLGNTLPEIHRKFDTVTVSKILETLASDVWELVVDPVNRLISFELSEKYRPPVAGVSVGEKIVIVEGADQ